MDSPIKLATKLKYKLDQRQLNDNLRCLDHSKLSIDFDSNDYLGLAKNSAIFKQSYQYLVNNGFDVINGGPWQNIDQYID